MNVSYLTDKQTYISHEANLPLTPTLSRQGRGSSKLFTQPSPAKGEGAKVNGEGASYLLLNWKPLLARFRPYFFRSFTLGSRVRKPWRRSGVRISVATSSSAMLIPWRTAPAWPAIPPPLHLAMTSYFPAAPTASKGCKISNSRDLRPT